MGTIFFGHGVLVYVQYRCLATYSADTAVTNRRLYRAVKLNYPFGAGISF